MKSATGYVLQYILRFLGYIGIMFLINAIYMHDAQMVTSTGKFGEISVTEITQEVFLFLSAFMFLFIGRMDHSLSTVSNLISIFLTMSFIRELNNYIDFWFYLVLPLIFLFIWIIIRDRKVLFTSTRNFLKLHQSAYFISGFMITYVFSRLFGRSKLWMRILEDDYNRWAKSAAEEGIELLGYTFFLIASLEIFIKVLNDRKKRAHGNG